MNGKTIQGHNAFLTLWDQVWVPAYEVFAALQYDWSYAKKDGEDTLTLFRSSTKSNTFYSGALNIEDNCLYYLGSMFPVIFDGATAEVSADKTTFTITAPTGTFTGTPKAGFGSGGTTVDTSNNDAQFKLVQGFNGGNTDTLGVRPTPWSTTSPSTPARGGTYTMTFPYAEGKADTVTLYTTPGGVYQLTYIYGLKSSSNYDYTYDMNITLTGPNNAALRIKDKHPGTLSAGGLSYEKVDDPAVTP